MPLRVCIEPIIALSTLIMSSYTTDVDTSRQRYQWTAFLQLKDWIALSEFSGARSNRWWGKVRELIGPKADASSREELESSHRQIGYPSPHQRFHQPSNPPPRTHFWRSMRFPPTRSSQLSLVEMILQLASNQVQYKECFGRETGLCPVRCN